MKYVLIIYILSQPYNIITQEFESEHTCVLAMNELLMEINVKIKDYNNIKPIVLCVKK